MLLHFALAALVCGLDSSRDYINGQLDHLGVLTGALKATLRTAPDAKNTIPTSLNGLLANESEAALSAVGESSDATQEYGGHHHPGDYTLPDPRRRTRTHRQISIEFLYLEDIYL